MFKFIDFVTVHKAIHYNIHLWNKYIIPVIIIIITTKRIIEESLITAKKNGFTLR